MTTEIKTWQERMPVQISTGMAMSYRALIERSTEENENKLVAMQAEIAELRAALAAEQPQAGWKLVPIEPTEKMIMAYTKCKTVAGERWAKHQWAAMIKAAPEAK